MWFAVGIVVAIGTTLVLSEHVPPGAGVGRLCGSPSGGGRNPSEAQIGGASASEPGHAADLA